MIKKTGNSNGTKQTSLRSIEDYFLSLPDNQRDRMERLRLLFKKAVPDAKEAFSYQMPSFKLNGMLAYYAVFTNHYSIYFSPDILNHFRQRLDAFSLSKSTIRIPFDAEFPEDMLVEMIKLAAIKNAGKMSAKKKKK